MNHIFSRDIRARTILAAAAAAALLTACASVTSVDWRNTVPGFVEPARRALNAAKPTAMAKENWSAGPNSNYGTVETLRYYEPGSPGIRCYELQINLNQVPSGAKENRPGIGCAGPSNVWTLYLGISSNLARPTTGDFARAGALAEETEGLVRAGGASPTSVRVFTF